MVTDTATVSVVTPPLQITPDFINLQFNAGFDFNASGGQTPYVFSILTGGDSGSIVADTGVYTAPATAGTVTVQVADSLPSTPSTATVNVYAPLVIAPDPATVDAGSTLTFTASGGVPGYTFEKVSGVGSISSGGVYDVPTSPGSAVVKVTDSIGNVDQTTVTVLDPADWAPAITVDTAGGQYASLVLTDADEWPYIAYRVGTATNTLKFAKWTGSCVRTRLRLTVPAITPGSMRLSRSMRPTIRESAITIPSRITKVSGTRTGMSAGYWTTRFPALRDDPIGQYASLALDSTDSYRSADCGV